MGTSGAEFDALYDSLLDLAEEHQDSLHAAQFASILIMFAVDMLYGCAPSVEEAESVLRRAIDHARPEQMKGH